MGTAGAVTGGVGLPGRNPLVVPGTASIMLAGQAAGITYRGVPSAPLNSPAAVDIPLTAGQALQFRAIGTVASSPPEGSSQMSSMAAESGLSEIIGPLNALVGVFLAPTIDTRNSPATLNFSGAARDLTRVEPLLQQVFYVGNGLTSTGAARQIVVPAGATRLYLGYLDGNPTTNAGSFVVGVSTGASDSPQITSAGIVSAAGFGQAPAERRGAGVHLRHEFGAANNATTVPLPTALGDTQVYFNTTPAPLFFVSGSQINAQIPYELRNEKRLLVTVTRGNNAGVPAPLDLTEFAPGIFTTTDGPIISDITAGRLVTRDQPVRRGDTIVMYATGLGPVLYDAASGTAAADAGCLPRCCPSSSCSRRRVGIEWRSALGRRPGAGADRRVSVERDHPGGCADRVGAAVDPERGGAVAGRDYRDPVGWTKKRKTPGDDRAAALRIRLRPFVLRIPARQLLPKLRIQARPETRKVGGHLHGAIVGREKAHHDGDSAADRRGRGHSVEILEARGDPGGLAGFVMDAQLTSAGEADAVGARSSSWRRSAGFI